MRITAVALPLLLLGGECGSKRDIHKISYDPGLPLGGAAGHERAFDVKNSPYYTSIDFYNKKSTESLTLIENFRTIQQATEVTCGPVCALMVLEHYGKREGYNEKRLQELRGTDQDTTYLRHLIRIFDEIGGFKYKSTYDYQYPNRETIPEDFFLEYLQRGIPVIVGTDTWNGHWQIIIGYDTMGTPCTADDVLILAEPYDTTDHNQDGYTIVSWQYFYCGIWRNHFDPDYTWGLFLAVWPE
ncbi:C39 family peptidase [uncultured Proteiniphilum sp.]|uniref:C39 family peptidase n=1 Tax=uncultured Proteiniphilum sp. TaxID=497637 RepID=UPI00261B1B11|nr:C39 family peptidase [uncultured Proteiniphilum sp.]